MSEPAARPFYVTGGTLKPGEPSYVERQADEDLYESLLAGEFCYVLTARQMGKSSLMARTAKRLEQAGVASAIVDLTQIGSERGDQAAAQWYFGIANQVHRQLGITTPLRPWWQERADLSSVQRLTDFFREVVLPQVAGRVVIFVDEIDSTIGLSFADDFFAAVRACFNARATEEAFERLTFVLLGVAAPDQLIQDPARTPFNIGKRIDLTDFRLEEARVLSPGLHLDPAEADRRLERVLHWTGGHPYLTQAVCRAVRERGDAGTIEEAVDPQVEELFLSSRAQREETNLKHARARLEKRGPEGRQLLQIYRRVRQGKVVQDQPTSPLFAQLKLSGVVKGTGEGRLAVRNRIYETVFSPEWVKAAMPVDRGRQLAAATLAAAFTGVLIWYAAFQPRPYEEAFRAAIQDDGYTGAFDAYTALRRNPFSRSKATELMQEFWEQRGLRYALAGQRDESLLSYLKGLEVMDSSRLRRQARNLVGGDYERLRLTIRLPQTITSAAFSPDGRSLATAAYNGEVRLWDPQAGVSLLPPLLQLRSAEIGTVAVAFSPDGQTLAAVSGKKNGGAQLWEIRSGKPRIPLLKDEDLLAVTFSPDSRTFAIGSSNGTASLWDAQSGRPLARFFNPESIDALAFDPDGRSLAIVSSGAVRFWGIKDKKFIGSPSRRIKEDNIFSTAFSFDGSKYAVGSAFGSVLPLSTRTGKPLASPLQHNGSIFAIAFSANGKMLATAATQFFGSNAEGGAGVWSLGSGKLLISPFLRERDVYAVAFHPDGSMLATGSEDRTIRLWDLRVGGPGAAPFRKDHIARDVRLSSDGRILVRFSAGQNISVLDVRTGKSFPLPSLRDITALAMSSDGLTLATGSSGGVISLTETRSGRMLTLLQQEGPVSELDLSHDGRRAAVVTRGGNHVSVWDVRSRKRLGVLEGQSSVIAMALSPDGQMVAVAYGDATTRVMEIQAGGHSVRSLPYESYVSAVAFSPDSRTLVTGSIDRAVRFWDTRTGNPLGSPLRVQNGVRAVAFHPNGTDLLVATVHWLNTYSWARQEAKHRSAQLLHGFRKGVFGFPAECERCFQVVSGDIGNSFHLETLDFDGPIDPPIEGAPQELLEVWQARLGLKFDEQMRPVPR